MLLQNLHRHYLYIVIRLPKLKDLDQKIPTFPNCDNVNPFSTEPLAVFLLLETDNLGVIHKKFIKNRVIILEFIYIYQTNTHIKGFKYGT